MFNNIFTEFHIKVYGGWKVILSRPFNEEELSELSSGIVTVGDFGNSVCFTLKSGNKCYFTLDQNATVGIGDSVNPEDCIVKVLSKEGEDNIIRILV